MEKNNKLIKGMLMGALVGASLSLLDQDTRRKTVNNAKNCSQKLWSCLKNPTETVRNISSGISSVRFKIEEISDDVLFIIDKVNEIKGTTKGLRNCSNRK